MANAIPLLGGTDASGGYLIRDEFGAPVQNQINRQAAALSLSQVQQINSDREVWPVYAGRPTAAFVAEGAAKNVTGAEFSQLSVDVKKIATIVLYTEEVLADAATDPQVLVNADVASAFSDLIDAHILGYQNGTSISTSFNNSLRQTTQTQEFVQASADGLAKAISAAIGTVEANGYNANGLILPFDARQHLRDARDASFTSQPLYTPGFAREPDSLYGLNVRYSTNLPSLAGAAAAGRVVGIVGDFTGSLAVMRKGLTMDSSNQATVDVSGTLHHLWQQNKVAARWEMRMGYTIHDRDRRFVAIINAA
jgi:HK97 family phage major capsid protein